MANATQSLSAYEQARIDKIKRNEDRLKSLGLLKAKEDMRASSRKKTPRKRRVKASAVTQRKSRRLSKQPVQFVPSFDDGDEYEVQQKKRKIVYDAPGTRGCAPIPGDSFSSDIIPPHFPNSSQIKLSCAHSCQLDKLTSDRGPAE